MVNEKNLAFVVLKILCPIFLSLIAFLAIPLSSLAGDTVYYASGRFSATIEKETDARSPYYTNYILQDIAVGRMQNISDVHIRLDCHREIALIRTTDSTYRLDQDISGCRIHPLIYKSADISRYLLPGNAVFTYALADSSGIVVRYVRLVHSFKDDAITGASFGFLLMEPACITSIDLLESHLGYTEPDYLEFREGLLNINDLHAAIFFLEDYLFPVQWEFPGELPFMDQYVQFLELSRIMNLFRLYDFESLTDIDPALMERYVRNYRLAGRYLRRLETFVDKQLMAGNFPSLQVVEGGAGKWVTMMDSYFRKGLLVDHQFTHFYNELIISDFLPEVIFAERQRLDSLHSLHKNTYYTDLIFEPLLIALYYRMLEKSGDYLLADDFQKAGAFLDKSLLVCTLASISDGCAEGLLLQERVGEGFARAYGSIIEKALEKDNLEIAEEYFNELAGRRFTGIAARTVDSLRLKIAVELFQESGRQRDKGMYGVALSLYDKALQSGYGNTALSSVDAGPGREALVDSLRRKRLAEVQHLLEKGELFPAELVVDHPDSLVSQGDTELLRSWIERERAAYYSGWGKKYQSIGAPAQALRSWYFAFDLRGRDDDLAGQQVAELALPLAVDVLENVKACIENLDVAGATTGLEEAASLIITYNLSGNAFVDSLYVDKEKMMGERICLFREKELAALNLHCDSLIIEGDYAVAEGIMDEYLASVDPGNPCRLDLQPLRDRRGELSVKSGYLKMIEELKDKGDPAGFIEQSLEIDRYYDANRVPLSGIAHTYTPDRVLQMGQPGLLAELLNHYLEIGSDKRALEALWAMREAGFESKPFREQQANLGARFAENDFRQDTGQNRYIYLNEHTLNYPWFDSFRKSYLERWEKLTGEE